MEETGRGLVGGSSEKHQYPSQDNNTWSRPNLVPSERKTSYVTLQKRQKINESEREKSEEWKTN
jgi:hypothetical protein